MLFLRRSTRPTGRIRTVERNASMWTADENEIDARVQDARSHRERTVIRPLSLLQLPRSIDTDRRSRSWPEHLPTTRK